MIKENKKPVKPVEKICFVVNPRAAGGKADERVEWIWRTAQKRWDDVSLFLTDENGRVRELENGKERTFDMIVACGGDGTIHRVINQFAESGIPFGVLPIGSGNDFVKSCHLPSRLTESFDLWLKGTTRPLDLVKISGDASAWAVNTVGMGFDGLANYIAHKGKMRPGRTKYTTSAFLSAFRSGTIRFSMEIDGTPVKEDLLMATVCNGKIEGGTFHVSPESDLFDGKLELVTLSPLALPKLLFALPKFKKGVPENLREYQMRPFRTLTLQTDKPFFAHADGEHLGRDLRTLTLEIVPGKVELAVL